MKNLTDKQKEFLENGFYIERNVFDTKDMEEIFINFYDICFTIALKHNTNLNIFAQATNGKFKHNCKEHHFEK